MRFGRLLRESPTILMVVIFAAIIGGPLMLIWSLNTLFNAGIEYSFWSWLAALWVGITIAGSSRS